MSGKDSSMADLSEKAAISIGEVHHTATRDGKTEWRLDAKTAEYAPGSGKVFFRDLTAVFYMRDNREITLTADRGVLEKDTNDIEVSGNVLVIDERFRLKTQRLAYEHGPKVIYTRQAVRVVSEAWDLEADSMSMDLDTQNMRFEGKVRGTFDEMFSL
jgi:LPS export ABC transporter protein LptC